MFLPQRSNSSFLHIKLKWTCKFADAPNGAIKTCGTPAESGPSHHPTILFRSQLEAFSRKHRPLSLIICSSRAAVVESSHFSFFFFFLGCVLAWGSAKADVTKLLLTGHTRTDMCDKCFWRERQVSNAKGKPLS